ncbi:sensor histidine kinase [Neobacillus cucumis]|uniref:sensor histidine kinase n=1 Tax=Neobacillus cucumis TaxID=1740721 RepID=UPI00196547B8|nr:HAMP domain-containing sensor histidine kinase [Neobacillus cucumis]MBM7656243.1 two-component system sporulation sensor kinase B [Neobacillus cucumis]
MEITKHFFFNLAIIITILFFGLLWLTLKRKFHISKRFAVIWSIILIWVCFQFSYHPTPNIFMDLRELPVLIGGLYLGIGPMLCFIVILIRGLYGLNIGFFANAILYLVLAILLWRIYPWFWSRPAKKRIYISLILGIIISLVTLTSVGIIHGSVNLLDYLFAYLVVPPLGISMISMSIETVLNNILIRDKLLKAGKLEVVEQMGAAISHEIRNPLTAAKGFVQLLKEDPLSQKQAEYLSIISAELDSAERVIKDYLTFAKPSIEKLEQIDVMNELKRILSILQPTANQYSVELITNFELVGFLLGERQKFHQCFLNVIKNGIEAMPQGGQLTITTESGEKYITILIKDYGVGMTKEQIERLGEPYYSTKEGKGTGLGMMVAYSIVRSMNGKISVNSEMGIGTTFCFSFPIPSGLYSKGEKLN